MARVNVIVLGAGVVGTSVALHLAKRGSSVALIDRGAPGEETSYGNAGIIEGNTIFPPGFPSDPLALLRIGLKLAPEANYKLSFLPKVLPWLMAFRNNTRGRKLIEQARITRPLFASAIPEHETLLQDAGAERYLRKTGWLKVYRKEKSFDATARERALAADLGVPIEEVDVEQARVLEPDLAPVFKRALFWPKAASISNPLGVTQAYFARFEALGGVLLRGDARSLHRNGAFWRVETDEGPIDGEAAVVALGPWSPDLLEPMGLRLPMAIKRGYHRHFRGRGNSGLLRPVLDADYGYVITPMEQGLRVTTGAEFAPRDDAPTPVQFERLMPGLTSLFPVDGRADERTWKGARPCFPDSRPAIGPAPGLPGLWLATGHAHWGLTLGPATGRLIGEMMAGEVPYIDPAPYRAERFL